MGRPETVGLRVLVGSAAVPMLPRDGEMATVVRVAPGRVVVLFDDGEEQTRHPSHVRFPHTAEETPR